MRARRSARHHSRDGPAARPPYWRYAWPASPTIDLLDGVLLQLQHIRVRWPSAGPTQSNGVLLGIGTRLADVGPSRRGGRSGSGRGGEGTSTAVVAATAPPPAASFRTGETRSKVVGSLAAPAFGESLDWPDPRGRSGTGGTLARRPPYAPRSTPRSERQRRHSD